MYLYKHVVHCLHALLSGLLNSYNPQLCFTAPDIQLRTIKDKTT